MIARLLAYVRSIPAIRLVQVVLAMGIVVLLAGRDARPLGFWPGLVIGAVILVPNLLMRKFRFWVWLGSLVIAALLMFATRHLSATNFVWDALDAWCHTQPPVEQAHILDQLETHALITFWGVLGAGMLLRFVDPAPTGRLDRGAARVVLACGVWLAAAGLASREDPMPTGTYVATCSCDNELTSSAATLCPDLLPRCWARSPNEEGRYETSATCTLVPSSAARLAGKVGWGLIAGGLAMAAAGMLLFWMGRKDSPPPPLPGSPKSASHLDWRLVVFATFALPLVLLGALVLLSAYAPNARDVVHAVVPDRFLLRGWR